MAVTVSAVWARERTVPTTSLPVTSVNVVENADGLEVATAQAALGGSCRVTLVCGGLSISPMASAPVEAVLHPSVVVGLPPPYG